MSKFTVAMRVPKRWYSLVVVKDISTSFMTVYIKDSWDGRTVVFSFSKTNHSVSYVRCVGNNDRKSKELSCIPIVSVCKYMDTNTIFIFIIYYRF